MFGRILCPGSFDSLKGLLVHKQVSLPIILGGIGFILTSTITLAAYLRNYTFVTLIVAIKFMVNQHPFLLKALMQIDNNTFPFQLHLIATCHLLPPLAWTCFPLFEELIGQQMVHFQDSILEHLHHHTFFSMFSNGIFKAHCAQILSWFGFGVNTWFIIQPIFPTFQLSSQVFCTLLWTWLELSHPSIACLPWCVYTHPIDPMGIHLLLCAHDNERTKTRDVIRDTFVAIVQDVGSMWDENNYMHFLQLHSIPPIDKLTLCSLKIEFAP